MRTLRPHLTYANVTATLALRPPLGLDRGNRSGGVNFGDGGTSGPLAYPEAMQMIDVQTVVFREGEHVVAQCLDVDVSSFGDTESDALDNLREALELYFEDAPADALAKVEGPEVRRLTLQRA
jgi:hypothetical protein